MADPSPQIAQSVRRKLGDRPPKTRSVDVLDNNPAHKTITLPSGHIAKFPMAGATIEWDDGTGERDLVDSVDQAAGTLTVIRGEDDTIVSDHAAGATLLIGPRFSWDQLIDSIKEQVESELWPYVWVPKETVLTYHPSSQLYAPPDDAEPIKELVYVYQVASGRKFTFHAEFLPAELSDDAAFPNGTVVIRRAAISGDIFVAYRAMPTLENLTPELTAIVAWGAAADLLTLEEAVHVGPDRSAIDARVSDGAKYRAGIVLRQSRDQKRDSLRIALLAAESLGSDFGRAP